MSILPLEICENCKDIIEKLSIRNVITQKNELNPVIPKTWTIEGKGGTKVNIFHYKCPICGSSWRVTNRDYTVSNVGE